MADENSERDAAPKSASEKPPADKETLTTEMVEVDVHADVPFHLPHISELREDVPRDARKEAGGIVTMPVYREIRPAAESEPTLLGPRPFSAPQPKSLPKPREIPPRPTRPNLPARQSYGHSAAATSKSRGPRRKRSRRLLGLPLGCVWALAGLVASFCGGLTLLTALAALIFVPQVEAEWAARVAEVDSYRGFESTFIYDRSGHELYEAFGEGRRVRVDMERIPLALIQATVAIEDDTFFDNIGIDVAATLVAALNYLGADAAENTPGGSTITQQLVRNVLFDFEKRAERSIARKVEEILLAIVLTQSKSKEDILEMYFNEIYYGNLAYGVQTAAQTFFGKDVEALNLGEAAMLAGLPQAPASLDPLNPDPAIQAAVDSRWRQVLGEMTEEGYITQAQAHGALSEGLSFAPANVSLTAPHFTVYARAELERLMSGLGHHPEDIARGGLRVYTTLDQHVNRLAQGAAAHRVAQLAAQRVSNAAVVVTKPLTGEIIAMVGSVDYDNEAIDGSVNVTTAFRQPGSTVKPFTYAAAMERGMTAGEVLWDTRTQIEIPGQPLYTPRNYDGVFHGPMTMRTALANSYNIPAVQTLRLVGVDYLLGLLRRFGVTTLHQDAAQYGLSLALGSGEITLIELTNAFAVFANQGAYVPVTSILCVIDRDNVILYQYENGCPDGQPSERTVQRAAAAVRVLDARIAYIISDMLADNVARSPAMGANSPLHTDSIHASVKTGTTDDVRDNWTIGYTRNVAVGVWLGNNDGQPMLNSSGLTGAAPVWNAVLRGIYSDSRLLGAFADHGQLLYDPPLPPEGLSLRQICDVRHLSDPATGCPTTVNEWFLDGSAGIQPRPLPTEGSVIGEVSPGVYQTLALPLPPEIASGIRFRVQPGEKQPLPPRYCRVPVQDAERAMAAGARHLWFIGGPATAPGDAIEAERYAREANLPFLPTIDCPAQVYDMQRIGSVGAILHIQQPASGQRVTGVVPIIGTAQFDSGQADYYHLFIRGGQFADWTPLGEAHHQPVAQGQLEILHADALRAGFYLLRLGLIRGGNMVQAADIGFDVP